MRRLLDKQALWAGPEDIAFRILGPGDTSVPLSYAAYQGMLGLFAGQAGLGESHFTSHSLRRGWCTYLAMAGATIEEIKTRGDWASETVYPYLKTPLQTRILNDLRVAASLAAAGDGEEEWLEPGAV